MLYADNNAEMIVHVLYIHENHCIIRDSDAARTGTVDVYIMCILCVCMHVLIYDMIGVICMMMMMLREHIRY